MKSNILINVDKIEYLKDYKEAGLTAFLFALEGYSIGYNTYHIEEINNLEVSNKYILINRILDCRDVDRLKEIITSLNNIKGIVYEDIAVYQIVKELGLDIELIFFQNHFGTNIHSINFWLDRVDSMFVGNELTKEEIDYITKNSKKPICLHLYGHNQIMYSRRSLLKNWSEEFEIPYKNNHTIEDKATHVRFRAIENEFGTVMYSDKIFNGSEIYNYDNVKFYYINPTLVEHSKVMSFLENINESNDETEDDGFLHKPTIYKLKERSK